MAQSMIHSPTMAKRSGSSIAASRSASFPAVSAPNLRATSRRISARSSATPSVRPRSIRNRRTRKDAAAGVNGVTAAHYEADLEANLSVQIGCS